jgi:microcystin-dependent protein
MVSYSVPMGAIIPYAGSLDSSDVGQANLDHVSELGWRPVNGDTITKQDREALFLLLGLASGGVKDEFCYLPNLVGTFVRITDTTSAYDPDRQSRDSAAKGGNFGNSVGSTQLAATGLPTGNKLNAQLHHLPNPKHSMECKTADDTPVMQSGDPKMLTCTSVGGGDKESRPINAYANFLIAATETAQIPAGAILTYLGQTDLDPSGMGSANGLAACRGTSIPQGNLGDLYNVIRTTHGDGDGIGFNLPDYRGRFLRGTTSPGASADPDSASRGPMGNNGNQGASVGSIQGFATALPATPFEFHYEASSDHFKRAIPAAGTSKVDVVKYNEDGAKATINLFHDGADKETAPVNMAVDYYIATVDDPPWQGIGSVILFCAAEAQPTSTMWLKLDAQQPPLSKSDYNALWTEIGLPIDQGDTFVLPQPSGVFLRGRDTLGGRDASASIRFVDRDGPKLVGNVAGSLALYTTGAPASSFVARGPYLPQTDTLGAPVTPLPTKPAVLWPQHRSEREVSGGDKETRPINTYFDAFIKYA